MENDHDATTAAALEAVERRGEMVVRLLDPRHLGRAAVDVDKRYLALQVKIQMKTFETGIDRNLIVLFIPYYYY